MTSNRELLKQFVDGTPLPPADINHLIECSLLRRDGDTTRVTTGGTILLQIPPMGVEVTGDSASCPDDYAIAQEAQNQQARKGLDVGAIPHTPEAHALYYRNRERNEVANGLKLGTLREAELFNQQVCARLDAVTAVPSLLTGESNALDVQIGGSHYKDMAIQPVEFIEKNGIRFLEGCIIKRAARHDKKTGAGAEDLRKIIHEASLLLELRYGVKA